MEEVPEPEVKPGPVLLRVSEERLLVSVGTAERSHAATRKPLLISQTDYKGAIMGFSTIRLAFCIDFVKHWF